MPSHGGQLCFFSALACSFVFQFMPSHGGQQSLCRCAGYAATVSIHALARRATPRSSEYMVDPLKFQFMPSHGGQHHPADSIRRSIRVSIHALARRATGIRRVISCAWCFNSCPRTEGNPQVVAGGATGHSFNSCPRTEGNRHPRSAKDSPRLFQFMPSHGGQLGIKRLVAQAFSFNSCPRTEGNRRDRQAPAVSSCFNSCPRTEGNNNKGLICCTYGLFQFMPSHGGQRGASGECLCVE